VLVALAVLLGRLVRAVTRLRGGGSALPGWVALKIAPRFVASVMDGFRDERVTPIAVVTGSNGKSTTTSMVVAILEAHGKRVFSNPSGGNLPQGIASAMLADVSLSGKLSADVVILELDEAFGGRLVEVIKPTHALLLNIQADQLNRFFEPERVIEMVRAIAVPARNIIVNDSDANTRALGNQLSATHTVEGFDVADAAAPDGVYGVDAGNDAAIDSREPLVRVDAVRGMTATLTYASSTVTVTLPSPGIHYAVDAAGAVALAARLVGDGFDISTAARAVSDMKPVYGRGESVDAFGAPLMIVMMKNHPSLQANLDALEEAPESLYLAVDGGTPDPSWIYDIDISAIDHVDVLSGSKAWQWETRLAYADVPVGKIEEDARSAFEAFGEMTTPIRQQHRTAIVNYEQMMDLRRDLGYLEIEGE
jgi:UDP-N-acetylmuramoylalanine-D-glutamate ligase